MQQYCVSCHNPTARRGELSLAAFEIARADEHAEVAEKMIRKLRAGMMPPPGARPPDPAAVAAIVEALESRIDRAASARPNPGSRPFQRL
ncbi:MAG TPA: c-type cytochrome domain-containing protein, partial [Vicinamibacterales bacterium]|nr:c-type cytochrome domain-containing protein [Vicinamibacterales bacterium]